MTRGIIVSNPAAGRAHPGALQHAVRRLVAGGITVEIAETRGAGDGVSLARQAVAQRVDLVIAHGGDGTVAEVAEGVAGSGCPMGILPAGTGNLLAGNLGIARAPRAAAEIILAGRARSLDLGRMESGGKSRCFAVACGAGLDARMMRDTPARLKRTLGRSSYVLTATRLATRICACEIELQVDGVAHSARAAAILAANCRYLIPGLLPLPAGVRPDDGFLDLAIFDADSFLDVASQTLALLLRRSERHRGIRFLRGTRFRVIASPPMPVEGDGELAGDTPLTIALLPGALSVLAPGR
jgi:diacylglycerol kinase (ATP)